MQELDNILISRRQAVQFFAYCKEISMMRIVFSPASISAQTIASSCQAENHQETGEADQRAIVKTAIGR